MTAPAPRLKAIVRTASRRTTERWTDKALCAIEHGIRFELDLTPTEQLAVCARCPVKDECLAFGLANDVHQNTGSVLPIYGGLTWSQRDAMRQARRRRAA